VDLLEQVRQADSVIREVAPNFSYTELTTTTHRSHLEGNRRAGIAVLPALMAIARMAQEIREHFAKPVIVHSGYRGPDLNAAIGGSKTSQHMRGEAIDFHVSTVPHQRVFDWIRLESGLPYGQLILEGVEAGTPSWIHLSLGEPWRPPEKSRQAMTWSRANGYQRVT